MFSCDTFLLISLLNHLRFFHVSACDFNCPDKPVLTPPRLVLKYGNPASAICVACQKACLPLSDSVINMEVSLGSTAKNGTTLIWTVNHTTEWNLTPKCYYTDKNEKQCCSDLKVTVYQPPERVSISLNDTGPLIEDKSITLQCSVFNVAPVENLNVTFYRELTPLGSKKYNSTTKVPVNEKFALTYNITKKDNGVRFWCEAKLELGSDGPHSPPVVRSQNLTAIVYYGPELKVPANPASIYITRGETLHLNCLAGGNPKPSYNWMLLSKKIQPSGNNLTIESVDFQNEGQYVCTVSNNVTAVKVEFNVKVQENFWPYIIVAIVGATVLLLISVVVVYILYYKQNKMGKYQLKEVFRLGTVHHTAVPLAY